MPKKLPLVVNFKDVNKHDINLVGGKGANLGEMTQAGLPVPPGFIVTAEAYRQFIDANNIQPKIKALLSKLDVNDSKKLQKTAKKVRRLINRAPIPNELKHEIIKYYHQASSKGRFTGKGALVAIRSSATAEDLPDASFAGQQETFLNVSGDSAVLHKVRDAWSSLFTPRAIFYRVQKKFDHFKVYIAIPVQRMIQPDSSGVMFTIDPVTNDKQTIVVEAIYGLGELIVQGSVTPDYYAIDKKSFKIINQTIGYQSKMMIRSRSSQNNKIVKLSQNKGSKQKLTDRQVIAVAKLGHKVHQHYFFPQDIEWAIEKGKLYLVQTRPVTTIKERAVATIEIKEKPILTGSAASPGIIAGKIRFLKSPKQIHQLKKGEILLTVMTTPDYVPAMRRSAGIITDQGGQTSHAAIVSRELGVPCIVGTKTATKTFKTGQEVTFDGSTGKIYSGILIKDSQPRTPRGVYPAIGGAPRRSSLKTATKLYVNLGDPGRAAEVSRFPNDGLGLLRAEFMIADIGVHPRKMIKDRRQKVFINKLTEGIKEFAQSFHPKPVVYRATDFKTNEYRHLIGGQSFEPEESNPMLGYRGAARYIADAKVFELELAAIKRVRNKYNLKNLHLMIPFVRTVQELKEVKKIVSANGLTRSASFQLWMMVEIPSNVILLEDFAKVGIDGISIGSNDLTMLILGIDRDNQEIAQTFDERDPAVLWALEKAICTAKKLGLTSSICGQAPSIYPDLVEKLVSWGITSISVSPDRLEATRELIYRAEKKLIKSKK
jgi:pyruvate,water dikinase